MTEKWACAASWVDEAWCDDATFNTREEAITYGMEVCKEAKAKLAEQATQDSSEWEAIEVFEAGEPPTDDDDELYITGCFDSFQIGKIYDVIPYIDGDYVIDLLEEQANEQCGEFSDGWFDGMKKSDVQELGEVLTKTLIAWLEARSLMPTFYSIGNIEQIEVV